MKHSLLNAIRYHDSGKHTEFKIWIEKRLQEDYVAIRVQWVVEVVKVTESGAGEAVIVIIRSTIDSVVHDITHIASDAADEITYPPYNHDIEI